MMMMVMMERRLLNRKYHHDRIEDRCGIRTISLEFVADLVGDEEAAAPAILVFMTCRLQIRV